MQHTGSWVCDVDLGTCRRAAARELVGDAGLLVEVGDALALATVLSAWRQPHQGRRR
jgi:hypothetical protein